MDLLLHELQFISFVAVYLIEQRLCSLQLGGILTLEHVYLVVNEVLSFGSIHFSLELLHEDLNLALEVGLIFAQSDIGVGLDVLR